MNVTYLCVISQTDNPTLEYFNTIIAPYKLILFSGYYVTAGTSTYMLSSIMHKDQLDFSIYTSVVMYGGGTSVRIGKDNTTPPKLVCTNATMYTYGIS